MGRCLKIKAISFWKKVQMQPFIAIFTEVKYSKQLVMKELLYIFVENFSHATIENPPHSSAIVD